MKQKLSTISLNIDSEEHNPAA